MTRLQRPPPNGSLILSPFPLAASDRIATLLRGRATAAHPAESPPTTSYPFR